MLLPFFLLFLFSLQIRRLVVVFFVCVCVLILTACHRHIVPPSIRVMVSMRQRCHVDEMPLELSQVILKLPQYFLPYSLPQK